MAVFVLILTGLLNPALAAAGTPYSDPAAVGQITLCDVRGQVATHGNIHTKPFVWRAVGTTPAPGPYTGPGRSAALYGYQPIKGVPADQWYGRYITGTGVYSNPKRPMAPATATDPSLADYLAQYPTKWDGLVQLRLFVAAARVAPYTATYNSATIRVTRDSWTLVAGGHDGCDSGTSTSGELVLPEVRALGTPAPNATTDAPSEARSGSNRTTPIKPSTGAASVTPAPTATATGGSSAVQAQGSARAADTSSSSSPALPWVLGVLGVLALAGGLIWWRFRPRNTD